MSPWAGYWMHAILGAGRGIRRGNQRGFLRRDRGISRIGAMAALKLQFLGDLRVVRAGERVALPPSKKTRALLAYLALNGRPLRREHLCELLWEIPDDPRGS